MCVSEFDGDDDGEDNDQGGEGAKEETTVAESDAWRA